MRIIAFLSVVLCSLQAAASGAELLQRFRTPIVFYGKVVDESGNPVTEASIKFGIHGEKSTYQYGTSDPAGRFEFRGVTGLGLAVWVSKDGYYAPKHALNYVYGGVRGKDTPINPTKENPAVFVLRRMGRTEPLVHIPRRSIRVPKDGTPVEIDLLSGLVADAGAGHLKIEVWTANEGMDPNLSRPYDWKARISIPNGGLIERLGSFEFTAPEAGYFSAFETGLRKDVQSWRDGFEREFFAKLRTGQYARFYVRLLTGGEHFIALDCFVNPKLGSRNLEFEPKQAIPAGR